MLLQRNRGRGQASMEYSMIVVLVAIIILPTIVVFYNYATESSEEIDRAQIDQFARNVVATAETVYYLGNPSRIVLEEKLPKGVERIEVKEDPISGTYVFVVSVKTRNGLTEFAYPTDVNMAGALFTDVGAGIKKIRIEAAPASKSGHFVTFNVGDDPACASGSSSSVPHNSCIVGSEPSFCFNGALIDACQTCGCPVIDEVEAQCKPDGSCFIPQINLLMPASGPASGGTLLRIIGKNFDRAATISIGGVAVTPIQIGEEPPQISEREINVTTPPDNPVGPAEVVVTNPDTFSAKASFTYTLIPVISLVLPDQGPVSGDTRITISGSNFVSGLTVKIGGNDALVESVTDTQTQIVATTPAAETAGEMVLEVRNPDGGFATSAFLYNPLPEVTSIMLSYGGVSGGQTATLQGRHFLAPVTVLFGSLPASEATVSEDRFTITATTPASAAGEVPVTVRNVDGGVSAMFVRFTFIPAPIIDRMEPLAGDAGTEVVIEGSNFFETPRVLFGDVAASSVMWTSETQIKAIVPSELALGIPVGITVVNPGEERALSSQQFVRVTLPTISAVEPASGVAGRTNAVTIRGTQFIAPVSVYFGSTPAESAVVVSQTELSVVAPELPAGSVDVTVTNPAGAATLSNGFEYVAPPLVSAVSPATGGAGRTNQVTVTGSNFVPDSRVQFGSTPAASVTFVSATELSVVAPELPAGSVDVVVSTDSGTATAPEAFTYLPVGRVFTTVKTYSGNLGGIEGAHEKCNAQAAELGGNWHAWLSAPPTAEDPDGTNAIDLIENRYYVNLNNELVANGKQDLITRKPDGTYLRSSIRDRKNNVLAASALVRTGTRVDGTKDTTFTSCDAWTKTTSTFSVVGRPSRVDSVWTNQGSGGGCESSNGGLYCFEVS